MPDYQTVLEPAETETVIKKSRFIGRVYHVESEEEIDEIISAVRKEHYKSTHVCSAWRLATDPLRQKASDDGEPSGTAGRPILEVIERRELKNVLVIVIRYFGGIKLGAGGLIRAYSGAASSVLDAAQIIKKVLCSCISVTIDYSQYGAFKNHLSEWQIAPVSEDFGEKITLKFEIPAAETEDFLARVVESTNDRCENKITGQQIIDFF